MGTKSVITLIEDLCAVETNNNDTVLIGDTSKVIEEIDRKAGMLLEMFTTIIVSKYSKGLFRNYKKMPKDLMQIATYVITTFSELINNYNHERFDDVQETNFTFYVENWVINAEHSLNEVFKKDSTKVQYLLNIYANTGLLLLDETFRDSPLEKSLLRKAEVEYATKLFERSKWWWEQFTTDRIEIAK